MQGSRALTLSVLIYLSACLVLRALAPELYLRVVSEDGPVETITALLYVGACLLSMAVARALYRAGEARPGLAYGLLALGFAFVAGEEVSWLQRILHFDPPEYFARNNLQRETTLHNLVHGSHIHRLYALVSGYALFARRWLPQRWLDRCALERDWVTPPDVLRPLFWPAFLYFVVPLGMIFSNGFVTWREQEPIEALLALGFAAFAADRLRAAGAAQVATLLG
jgi:hypothetical protein